jgi:hypothetical protein
MIEITQAVEAECPVGKAFGVEGVGEGVVWKCLDEDHKGSDYWFKVKGKKHSVTKVKTLAPVDIEKMKSVNDFIDTVLTDNRMKQGIEYLVEQGKPISRKSTGDFLSWVFDDIITEEADTMAASHITRKDLGKPVGTQARDWFFKYLDNQAGL